LTINDIHFNALGKNIINFCQLAQVMLI